MRRGDFVVVAMQGDYGKPRPALIVQSDLLADLQSVIVCPVTTALRADMSTRLRPTVEPTEANGLRETSQLMLDKLAAIPRAKVGKVIGVADAALMRSVTTSIAVMFDIASLETEA